MSDRSIDAAIYSFEAMTPELESPPIAARRALELAGLRLSIEGWRSLAVDDRQRIAITGMAETVDVDRVLSVVRRANPHPQRVPPAVDPDPSAPPDAILRALEPGRGLDARRWARLRAIDRYAIVHAYRRAVARSAMSLLGEALDAILVAGAASRAAATVAPPSAPSSYTSPGGYGTTAKLGTPPRAQQRTPPQPAGAVIPPPPAPPSAVEAMPASRRGGAVDTVGWAVRSGSAAGAEEPPISTRGPAAPAPVEPQISTHLNATGEVHMVDVAPKPKTERRAAAMAVVRMRPETAARIAQRETPKGEVLATARIAGIMAAKRTPELIPLCHGIALTKVSVDIEVDVAAARVTILATAEAFDRTGVEMEAMVAASVAGLTIYDMLKGVDRDMVISEVKLLEKSGGRSGHYQRQGRP